MQKVGLAEVIYNYTQIDAIRATSYTTVLLTYARLWINVEEVSQLRTWTDYITSGRFFHFRHQKPVLDRTVLFQILPSFLPPHVKPANPEKKDIVCVCLECLTHLHAS